MAYLKWDEQVLPQLTETEIDTWYSQGYVFGRQEKGVLSQTRSLRIDLSQFEPNSENRRILRKTEGIHLNVKPLPLSDYHWSIGKLAKDFYDSKFGAGTFSANKIKELLTDEHQSNFNRCFFFFEKETVLGYCIGLETKTLIHYSYPFYDLQNSPGNMGLGMMIRAIVFAKENKKNYIYLGSAQRPTDTYKLQFSGLEWFDGTHWQTDLETLKTLIRT